MIGDWLYALTPRDEQQTPIQLVRAHHAVSGTNTQLAIRYRPPTGFCLLLDVLRYTASPGNAQTIAGMSIRLLDAFDTATVVAVLDEHFDSSSRVTRSVCLNKLAIDSRHDTVEFRALFNAGANPNGLDASLVGVLIPVGNLAPARLAPIA